jgi:hypothetical protein
MTYRLAFFVALMLPFSCRKIDPESQPHRLDQFRWMLGAWSGPSGKGQVYESWARPNDTLMLGRSMEISGMDTISTERISLISTRDAVYYVPIVSNQNDGLPVSFKLVNKTDGKFVFENKEHDFPQRIIYQQLSRDSLVASIEGNNQGWERKVEFKLTRDSK